MLRERLESHGSIDALGRTVDRRSEATQVRMVDTFRREGIQVIRVHIRLIALHEPTHSRQQRAGPGRE